MTYNRGNGNRGTWTRKTGRRDAAEIPLSSRISSRGQTDNTFSWKETAPGKESASCWDAHIFDASFFEDNRKIFEWDDYGAVELLKKIDNNGHQGVSPCMDHFARESERYLESITDSVPLWVCTLPGCAEDLANKDEKKKALKDDFSRKQSGNTSPVILGLPGSKDEAGFSEVPSVLLPLDFVPEPTGWGSGEVDENVAENRWENSPNVVTGLGNHDKAHLPSAKLPLDFLPEPTGWGDVEDKPAESRWDDSLMIAPAVRSNDKAHLPSVQLPLGFVPEPTGWGESEEKLTEYQWNHSPMDATCGAGEDDAQVSPPIDGGWQQTNANKAKEVWGETGRPEYPNSYQHIIPSGWDVQLNSPKSPSGHGTLPTGSPILSSRGELRAQRSVLPSGWRNSPAKPFVLPSGWDDRTTELRSNEVMCRTKWNGYCQKPDNSCTEWGSILPSAQKHEGHHNARLRKQKDVYNNSYKSGYWRPKRDLNSFDSSGRKTIQKPGRPMANLYKANFDARSPRLNCYERSRSQRLSGQDVEPAHN